MKYIEEAIDIKSPYAKKYLKLVSRSDTGDRTEDHHIVPVAYFSDVLKIKNVRKASSPDMDRDNIVALTPGHHLLAHYYLYKCARECIRPQMASAVSMMFSLKDIDTRISQLTERQAREIASAKDEAKAFSGWKTRRLSTGFISKILYKDGKEVYGFLLHPNGKVRQYRDGRYGFHTDQWGGDVHAWCNDIWDSRHRKWVAVDELACTSHWVWDKDKHRHVKSGAICADISKRNTVVGRAIAKRAITFRRIIEKFYPRFKNAFDDAWNEAEDRFMEMFPGIKPYRIPDVPKVV